MNMGSKYRSTLQKHYFAIVNAVTPLSVLTEEEQAMVSENLRQSGQVLPDEGEINLPIGRLDGSIIQRQVRFDEGSKSASTSFKIVQKKEMALIF